MALKLPRRAVFAFPLSALMSGTSRRTASQAAPGTAALPRLSYAGTEIAPVTVDPAHVDIRVTIDLAGDRPMASYMAARPRGLPAVQRTAAGAWVVWDQRTESLIDNRFASSGGVSSSLPPGTISRRKAFQSHLSSPIARRPA